MTHRVAMVLPSLRGGGLERVAADLCLALPAFGWSPGVFCVAGLGVHAERLSAAGVPLADCKESGAMRLRGVNRRLIKALRAFAPDVIHAHSGTWLAASVARRLLGTPRLVFTDHGRYPPEPWVRSLIERWCNRQTDRLLVVSAPLGEYDRRFLRLDAPPMVMPNGIDLEPYQHPDPARRAALRAEWGLPPDAVACMAVGRLVPVKNHTFLLDAFAAAAARAPVLRLLLVGQGPLEAELRAHADALGISRQVGFVGYREDIPACLQAADCFALTSTTEGHPVSLLEAFAAGLPAVATRVGGVGDAMGPDAPGVLVEVGDVPALADALVRMATDGRQRGAWSDAARRRAEAFSLQVSARAHARVYESVMKGTAA